MTAAAAVRPGTNLWWRHWKRRMVEELDLSATEAHTLEMLVDRASGEGVVRLGVPLMAAQLRLKSESQVHKRLGALTRHGLLSTRQLGPGRIARRQLCAVPVPPAPEQVQLSLFDGEPAAAEAPEPAAAVFPVAPWSVVTVEACPRIDAPKPSHQCEAAVEVAVETTEGSARCAPDPASDPPLKVSMVLQPRLDDVLGVLGTAPGLVIEPMAVNSALAAHPESAGHDHLRAAFTVASWAFEGGLRHSAANRLLLSALRPQTRPAAAAGGGRGHEGRARRAPAVPAVVTGGYMRED